MPWSPGKGWGDAFFPVAFFFVWAIQCQQQHREANGPRGGGLQGNCGDLGCGDQQAIHTIGQKINMLLGLPGLSTGMYKTMPLTSFL